MKPTVQFLLAATLGVAGVLFFPSHAAAGEKMAGIGPDFKGPIGLQLYSLRNEFNKDVPGTLDEMQKWGIKYGELAGTYKVAPADFRAQMLAHGITPVSGHFGFEQYRDHLDDVVNDAQALGLKYAGCAWIPHKGAFDEKALDEAVAVFNHAGEVLAQHGMRFFYHVHGYEFQPTGNGDSTLFDELMAKTNPKYVHFEMDIFWIVFPGQDPVKLLKKYKHRWELMHLKDMRKGLATGSLAGGTDVKNDVAIGAGQMDIPAILKAAKKAGIKWYFIEDESPSSEQQIPQSLDYLEHVKF